jgi:hypothetical protein
MNICKKKSIRSSKPQTTISKKTLDIQHTSYIDNVRKCSRALKDLKAELDNIEREIRDVESCLDLTEEQAENLVDLKDRRAEIREELAGHHDMDEVSYMTNTASILFKYYDLLENKKPLDSEAALNVHKTHSILKYFCDPCSGTNNRANNIASDEKKEDVESNRGSLLDKYMQYVDNNYVKAGQNDDEVSTCQHCGSEHVTIMNNDGYILCNDCHSVEYIIVDHDKPSYKDPPKEISYFAYKRINHFRSLIEVFSKIETYIKLIAMRLARSI